MVVASTGFSESLETSIMLCPAHRYVVLLLLLLLLLLLWWWWWWWWRFLLWGIWLLLLQLGEREEIDGIVT
jgi:hypothetical protein